jgi:Type IV secretion-system coupling protein DNA-binding domain
MSGNIFAEGGRTQLRIFGIKARNYLLLCALISIFAGWFYWRYWLWPGYKPLQQIYFRSFLTASFKSWMWPASSKGGYQILACSVQGGDVSIANDDTAYPARDAEGGIIENQYGYVFRAYQGTKITALDWRRVSLQHSQAERLFRGWIYNNKSLWDLLAPAGIVALAMLIGGTGVSAGIDQLIKRKNGRGKRVSGSRMVKPRRYEREHKQADGLALTVKALRPEGRIQRLWWRALGEEEPTHQLRMQRSEEAQGILILGDTRSGKTQIIHRFLEQIARREDEAAVIYDPSCELIKAHFNTKRGDVVLNPLDERSPFWSPEFECLRRNKTDFTTLADSFFPGRGDRTSSVGKFSNDAARDLFARMLEFGPDPEKLATWLSDERWIAELTEGDAKGQKVEVLWALAQVGKTLRLLPRRSECEFDFSLSEWATERRGWIFLTATKETEEGLKPLYAVYLDLLMRRLLSIDDEEGRRRPVKLILDESQALDYLPTLRKAALEGRKFGLHLVQGIQDRAQYEARYGREAAKMLNSPRYSILLRCKEPESAKWLSSFLGEEEREKPRTASVNDWERDFMDHTTRTERRALVSKEEIETLPDLAGYWKHGEVIVPFRFDFREWKRVAEWFIPRQSTCTHSIPEMPKKAIAESTESETTESILEILKREDWE